jgi:hypothetical protein
MEHGACHAGHQVGREHLGSEKSGVSIKTDVPGVPDYLVAVE